MWLKKILFALTGWATSDNAYELASKAVPLMMGKVGAKTDSEMKLLLRMGRKVADEEAVRQGHEKYKIYYRMCVAIMINKAYNAKCIADIASAKTLTSKGELSMAITAGTACARVGEFTMETILAELASLQEDEGDSVPIQEIVPNAIKVFEKNFDKMGEELDKHVSSKYDVKSEETKFTEL